MKGIIKLNSKKRFKLNKAIERLDNFPLWWVGIILFIVTFLPFLILKGGSIFEIHDQLDESILSYVLSAKYLGTGVTTFPEMLGGVNASGMQPGAVLFTPLYKWLPVLTAFIVEYAVVFISGFFGMYFCVKEFTKSSIIALAMAGCFSLLPIRPIYGLSILGVPIILYAFLCLMKKKKIFLSILLIIFFGLTTHLVWIGYAVISFWILGIFVLFIKKRLNNQVFLGFALLILTYIIINYNLIYELLMGSGDYISHREEFVSQGAPFWDSTISLFLNSGQHAPSFHKYLILPIMILLIIYSIYYKRLHIKEKRKYWVALFSFLILFLIAVLFGFCRSEWMITLRSNMKGVLKYFQVERFYWIYPAGWYLEFSLCFGIWWKSSRDSEEKENLCNMKYAKWFHAPIIKLLILCIILFPSIYQTTARSYFYTNVNQINNGSSITGYISWDSYYSEDLMKKIEDTIGRDITTYRIGHLGVSPSPALMHGFYTVDGYSNNYPLEYKHKMRQIISEEINQSEEMKRYFDDWGNRCYLFNHVTGVYWNLAKGNNLKFENISFDMNALRELKCEYIFAGSEILDAENMGLSYMGYFETENSYWGIWLYHLEANEMK